MKFDIEYNDSGIFIYFNSRDIAWIEKHFQDSPDERLKICYVFSITKADLDAGYGIHYYDPHSIEYESDPSGGYVGFRIGVRIDGGYRIQSGILGEHSLTIRDGSELTSHRYFLGVYNTDIMGKLLDVVDEDLTIGNEEGDLSRDTLDILIKKFPTKTELKHYSDERISLIISEDLDLKKDYSEAYHRYLQRKNRKIPFKETNELYEYDVEKLKFARGKIQEMLIQRKAYNEDAWQEEILKIIQVLFPQYILSLREKNLPMLFGHGKRVDFLLINSAGYLDIMEIKHPDVEILSKRRARNNIAPKRELSDCAMQVETYLHALTNSDKIMEKLKKNVMNKYSIEIKVLNPSGIILMGYNENDWSDEERQAIEIIRRQYRHISDVVTYNDLLERLDNAIMEREKLAHQSEDNGYSPGNRLNESKEEDH